VSKVLLKTETQQQEGVLGLEVAELANYLDLSLDLVREEVRPKRCAADRRAEDFDAAGFRVRVRV